MHRLHYAGLISLGVVAFLSYLSFNYYSRLAIKDLRVAFLIGNSFKDQKIDPASVSFAKQANLVLALYGRLVEFNQKGDLIPSMVSKFSINNNEVTFDGMAKQISQNGEAITFEDVEFSLKRLLNLNKNAHGKLGDMLVPDPSFRSIKDSHKSIIVNGNKLTLVVKNPNYTKFLLPLFANIDFSIVPKAAVDIDDPGLRIKNYRITSGAYYYSSSSEIAVTLKSNISDNLLYAKAASNIQLIESGFNEVESKFFKDEVDVVPMLYQISAESVEKVVEDVDLDFFETLPIRVWYIDFFKNKMALTENEFAAVKEVKEKLPFEYFEYGFKKGNELFPANSLASLDQMQTSKLKQLKEPNAPKQNKRIKIWVPEKKIELFNEHFVQSATLEFYFVNQYPPLLPSDNQPDAMIIAMDSSYNEDLSLISYCFSFGQIKMTDGEQLAWMDTYINTTNTEERVKLLRELHFRVLSEKHITPLGFSPYVALARNGWKLNFSKFYAGTPLWQISKE